MRLVKNIEAVLASNNVGKLQELHAVLSQKNINLINQGELGVNAAEETGLTFIENAIIKARHAAACTGKPAIADDSGLVVAALHGEPGIYSARYAGSPSNDKKNNEKLLTNLKGIEDRAAYFYCVIVYLSNTEDPTPIVCEGKWQGIILTAPRGLGGFGYDPIFFIPELDKTSAELDKQTKNKISHRGQALKQLLEKL